MSTSAERRPVLTRVALVLAAGCFLAALVSFGAGGEVGYWIFAATALLIAGDQARRDHGGVAAALVGAGIGILLAGLALRTEPWLGQLTACALAAAIARGLWGEQQLRRELKASRTAMHQLQGQLGHALRVGSVGDLAGLVAHGLRNKLQVIQGQAALGRGDPPEAKDGRLESISAAILEAAGLVDQLLDLAHPKDDDPALVDLDDHVAGFAARAVAVLPHGIQLHVARACDPVPVMVDPGELEHALLNLVTNAKDAIGDSAGEIHLAVRAEGERAVLDVRDSGLGIEPALLDKVFEPYVTTKPRGEGTGLGLVAVQRFVAAAGGELRVESSVGHGSLFRVLLPLHVEQPRGVAG